MYDALSTFADAIHCENILESTPMTPAVIEQLRKVRSCEVPTRYQIPVSLTGSSVPMFDDIPF